MARPISRRTFLRGVALGAGWTVLPGIRPGPAWADPPPRARPPDGEWLAGDLHVHTVYSHDVWGGPGDDNTGLDEAHTLGWTPGEQIAIAESRGLDYLAITDHDRVEALSDPGYRSDSLILVPGYEHSLSKGHAGCLGVFETFTGIDTGTDAGALALRDAVWAAGGLFILNHPFYGSGWRYGPAVRPDSVEVWNIAWPFRKELFPFVATSENYRSLPYWEETFLATGRMPATGGSDNHWRSTTAAQGAGQPCTWVHAAERSWPAVLEGIRAGRTFVAAEPPALGGPRLFLTAKAGPDRWMVGDTVPAAAGRVLVQARAENAPGHLLRLVVDGVRQEAVPVAGAEFAHTVQVDAAALSRVRAELYLDDGFWMAALTSPIYFG